MRRIQGHCSTLLSACYRKSGEGRITPCLYRCELPLVINLPHSNLVVVTTHAILAICRERCSPYLASGVYFDGLGTLLSNRQHRCNSVSQVCTGQRWGHRERDGGRQAVVRILFASCTLFLVDILRPAHMPHCLVFSVSNTKPFLSPTHRQAFAHGRATLRSLIHALNLLRHQPLTRSRIKASDKISTLRVPQRIPVHGYTFFGLCILVPSSRRCSLQARRFASPIKLRILFAPTLLLVDASGTNKTAIVARTKGGVPGLPRWWARRTNMNRVSHRGISENYRCVCIPVCIMT